MAHKSSKSPSLPDIYNRDNIPLGLYQQEAFSKALALDGTEISGQKISVQDTLPKSGSAPGANTSAASTTAVPAGSSGGHPDAPSGASAGEWLLI